MGKKVTVELPDALVQLVEQMASAAGVTPGEIIAAQVAQQLTTSGKDGNSMVLPAGTSVHPDIQKLLQQVASRKNMPIDQVLFQWKTKYGSKIRHNLADSERKACLHPLHRYAGAVSSGDSHSADNDRIDAELAAEYENPHRMG